MTESFKEEYEMSHFILDMICEVPIGSIWFISDYLDDLFLDYKDFNEVFKYADYNNMHINTSTQLCVVISDYFIDWYRRFIKANFSFSGYLNTHSLLFNDKVFFFQVESQNLCFDKDWIVNDLGITKIPVQDFTINLMEKINIDDIW